MLNVGMFLVVHTDIWMDKRAVKTYTLHYTLILNVIVIVIVRSFTTAEHD